jgi:NAD(P)-dependent dehydrogenase (short-subunit alcohol dehydrogenase family)
MEGKICLVTGANAGIGLETVRGLARMGATVVMACRSVEKGEKAREDVIRSTGNANVHLLQLDLGSQSDVRRFAAEFRAHYPKLDVLVNNAGVFCASFLWTEDGVETQLATNHVGHFLLTLLLLEPLKAAAPSRVVMVSSGLHSNGQIDFHDLHNEKQYLPTSVYAQTKLANVLFANEFGRRFPGIGVTANSLHPGAVRTRIAQKQSNIFYSMGWSLLKPFMISPEKGAETSLYVATAPELQGVTGKYYDHCQEKEPAPAALDEELARRLWDETLKLCGMEEAAVG